MTTSHPLYFETSSTLPVDFHSFRRAFSTALAEAGVNAQHAMNLAKHSDPRVHLGYVMGTKAMRTVPEAALPRLLTASLPGLPIVVAHDDSSEVRDDSTIDVVVDPPAATENASGNSRLLTFRASAQDEPLCASPKCATRFEKFGSS